MTTDITCPTCNLIVYQYHQMINLWWCANCGTLTTETGLAKPPYRVQTGGWKKGPPPAPDDTTRTALYLVTVPVRGGRDGETRIHLCHCGPRTCSVDASTLEYTRDEIVAHCEVQKP